MSSDEECSPLNEACENRGMKYVPVSVAAVGTLLATDGGADDERAHRLVAEMIRGWDELPNSARVHLVVDEPAATGSQRWDALLGALAEHLCFHADLECPDWVDAPHRFLVANWFDDAGLPALRAIAWVGSPAAFRRRGIFIDPLDLVRV